MNWINISTRRPQPGVPVLICGKDGESVKTLRACWIPKYCEKDGEYYWPEGWYEWNECEETHWKIDFPVMFWMPMPELPKEMTTDRLYCIKVQADKDCWIADFDGDPGRTLIKESARTFKRKVFAEMLCDDLKNQYPNRNFWVSVY